MERKDNQDGNIGTRSERKASLVPVPELPTRKTVKVDDQETRRVNHKLTGQLVIFGLIDFVTRRSRDWQKLPTALVPWCLIA